MEMPNQDLIELLIKYNGHFKYDDYTTIINDGIFENEHFFIFNDHANIEGILFFLISKYPEDLIVFKSMRNAIYSTTTSSLYDIIDVDTYNEVFVIDGYRNMPYLLSGYCVREKTSQTLLCS